MDYINSKLINASNAVKNTQLQNEDKERKQLFVPAKISENKMRSPKARTGYITEEDINDLELRKNLLFSDLGYIKNDLGEVFDA